MGIYNKLKEIQEKRAAVPVIANGANTTGHCQERGANIVYPTKLSNLGKPFILYAIRTGQYARQRWLILFAVLVVTFNIKLLLMSWDGSKQSDKAFMQLAAVRSAVDVTSRKVSDLTVTTKAVTEDMERMATKVDNTNNKVKDLENSAKAQKAAIENLSKARNSTFNRLSNLEAEIENLKKALSSKPQATT